MICVEQDDTNTANIEHSSITSQNSLLANKEKYEEFKNSIFKDILGPAKRKNEEDAVEAKKQKVD